MTIRQARSWNNPFNDRPIIEKIDDPLGRDMYKINDKKYYLKQDAKPEINGYVVVRTGVILVVSQVERELNAMGQQNTRVTGTYIGTKDESSWNEGDYTALVPLVTDPCPMCGNELTEGHFWKEENFGKILWQFYKYCVKCGVEGVSPPGKRDEVTWWTENEVMFDPETRELLYNPNVDEDELDLI